MNKYYSKIISLILALTMILCQPLFAHTDHQLWAWALKAVREEKMDFALMCYRKLARQTQNPNYKINSLFAQAEYYYLLNEYSQSMATFNILLQQKNHPTHKLFALVYLLKIAQKQDKQNLVKKFEKNIIVLHRQSFIFKEKKEYKYLSPLNRRHKAVYTIDQVSFYVNNEPFCIIAY